MSGGKSYVYVISDLGKSKVGMSRNPNGRANGIASESGSKHMTLYVAYPVVADMARAIERKAHDLLRGHWIKGEWFSVTADQADEALKRAMMDIIAGDSVGRKRPAKSDAEIISSRIDNMFDENGKIRTAAEIDRMLNQ